jgi:hypothetical protein
MVDAVAVAVAVCVFVVCFESVFVSFESAARSSLLVSSDVLSSPLKSIFRVVPSSVIARFGGDGRDGVAWVGPLDMGDAADGSRARLRAGAADTNGPVLCQGR